MGGLASRRGVTSAFLALPVYVAVLTFLVAPIAVVLLESILLEGVFTLRFYLEFFASAHNLKLLTNSLLAAVLTVLASSLIGVPLGYAMARYRLRAKTLLMTLSLIPMILPPFVGALAFLFLFGRVGTISLVLTDWLHLWPRPQSLIDGLHGVVFIETLHLFPLIYLNAAAAFASIDPALEEAAEIQGASGLRRFFTVTFPLALPGYFAGAFLVFIWTFADWTTPAILGLSSEYLASQAFSDITQFFDVQTLARGLVANSMIILLSVALLLMVRHRVEARQYVALTKGTSAEGRVLPLEGVRRLGVYAFLIGVAILTVLAPIWLTLMAFARNWLLTPFPTAFTFAHFQYIAVDTPGFLANSLQFSVTAAVLDLILGVAVAFILARTRVLGRDLLDGLVTMALAIPGIVIGVGYLRTFHRLDLPFVNAPLTGFWLVMPLVIAVRRLPYVVRSSHAALLQLDPAFEEASEILGAGRLHTFRRVILPLIFRGVLVGTLFSFVTAIQEVSASMFLYRPGWETVTIGTFILFNQSAEFGTPAALGFVLMAVTALAIFLANRMGGRRLGGAFGL